MSTAPEPDQPPLVQIGRYTLLHQLASGGMGTVHLAKFHGEAGFSRMLAVKRLHPHFATDPDFLLLFLDEARIASRIRHPHVVSVVDVVSHAGELLLAMEYVQGLPLSQILRLVGPAGIPPKIAVSIAGGLLQGLHAAHEAKTDKGEFLNLVHRDVSPQNVMLGEDGAARVVDFGIASARARLQTTADGQVKGKLAYMAPEQTAGRPVDRRADVFSAGVVLWEMLSGQRLAEGDIPEKVRFMTEARFRRPSEVRPELPFSLDKVVLRALAKYPSDRFATAEDMLNALYAARSPAHVHEVRVWLEDTAGPLLAALAQRAASAEARTISPPAMSSSPLATSGVLSESAIDVFEDPSLTPPFEEKAASRSRLVPLLALATLIGGLVVALAFLLIERHEQDVSIDTEPPSPVTPQDQAARPPVTERPIDGMSTRNGERDSTAEAPPAPAVEKNPPVSERPARKQASDPCSPPYVLLKGGLKRYKPECL